MLDQNRTRPGPQFGPAQHRACFGNLWDSLDQIWTNLDQDLTWFHQTSAWFDQHYKCKDMKRRWLRSLLDRGAKGFKRNAERNPNAFLVESSLAPKLRRRATRDPKVGGHKTGQPDDVCVRRPCHSLLAHLPRLETMHNNLRRETRRR